MKFGVRLLAAFEMVQIICFAPFYIVGFGYAGYRNDVGPALREIVRLVRTGQRWQTIKKPTGNKIRLIGVANFFLLIPCAPLQMLWIGGKDFFGDAIPQFAQAVKVLRTGVAPGMNRILRSN